MEEDEGSDESEIEDEDTKSTPETFDISSFATPIKYTLRLDDVVSVDRSLAITTQSRDSTFICQDVQNIVSQNVQKALLSISSAP